MTIEFILPDIGEGIVECELLEWLVSEGEHIEEDQPVAEVMTDKATVQIPAMHAGVVNKLHYAVGDIAKVHAPLFAMTPDDANANSDTQEDAQAEVKENASETATANDSASSGASNGKHIEDFILPDIGEGIVECEIVKWNVAEGDEIEEDQAVVDRCRHFTPNLRWLVSEGYITEFTDGMLCSSTASSRPIERHLSHRTMVPDSPDK